MVVQGVNPLAIDRGPVGAELDDGILGGFGPLTPVQGVNPLAIDHGPSGADVDDVKIDHCCVLRLSRG